MIKFVKSLLFTIAAVIMCLCLMFVPECSGIVSAAYISVLGIYLGLDLAAMISSTSELPKGEYKKLSIHKYILSSVALVIQVAMCFISDAEMQEAKTALISASMIILGCLIGGLEGNKIATKKGA